MKKFLLIITIFTFTINIFAEKTCEYTYQSDMGKFDPETNLIIELTYQIDQCDVISNKDINKLILESQKQILEIIPLAECVVGKYMFKVDIEYLQIKIILIFSYYSNLYLILRISKFNSFL